MGRQKEKEEKGKGKKKRVERKEKRKKKIINMSNRAPFKHKHGRPGGAPEEKKNFRGAKDGGV